MIHALFFFPPVSYQFVLEGEDYKDFKIAGIKGLSKIAQHGVLLGMFLCQKKIIQLYFVLVFFLSFSCCCLVFLLISMVTLRELPTANLTDVLLVAETTSRCHNWLRAVLWFEQLSACKWGGRVFGWNPFKLWWQEKLYLHNSSYHSVQGLLCTLCLTI